MNKRLFLLLIPAVLSSTSIFACQESASDQKTHELANVAALQAQGKEAMLFSFQEQKCGLPKLARNDGEVSGYLPSDEDWQGLYSMYRFKGDKPLDALAHVYNTMLDSSISLGNSPAERLSLYARNSAMAHQNGIGG